MVAAPRHVYSAIVRNLTPKEVMLKAFYAMPNAGDEETVVNIKPGGTARLEQKIVEMSTYSMTAHIRRVEVEGAFLESPFDGVFSPVKEYNLEIHERGGAYHLQGSL
uniref:Uncharacterized protein n=1 Tax=Trypanosoma congolense (strain IL3000) TaxID=1068625 RepID=G0UNX9_TRYCI|nr:conserved hypothetical protein [Trypanosoma congolense IL3000]